MQIITLNTHSVPEKLAVFITIKSAMNTASMEMAQELGPHNIRVNTVAPGHSTSERLDTMWQCIADQTGETATRVSEYAARAAALNRHVDPEGDIEPVALFLASEDAQPATIYPSEGFRRCGRGRSGQPTWPPRSRKLALGGGIGWPTPKRPGCGWAQRGGPIRGR